MLWYESCFIGLEKLQVLEVSVITAVMLMTGKMHGVGSSDEGMMAEQGT